MKLGVIIVLGLVSMMLGVYGIYAGSMGEATLQVMGAHLNTIDVGVALRGDRLRGRGGGVSRHPADRRAGGRAGRRIDDHEALTSAPIIHGPNGRAAGARSGGQSASRTQPALSSRRS